MQIESEFTVVPCKNKERLNAVRALFQKMGATPEEFSIDRHTEAQNLVVTMKGSEPGKIVFGAHYDFVDDGCGAIDNWTGIVAMAHTYRSVRQLGTKKTVHFVAFGNEEKGLLGSAAMARAIRKEDLPQYCAMINIDSFGMGMPFALKNVSSPKLAAEVAAKSKLIGIPFYEVSIGEADADSHSFVDRKIPAVTLSGLSNDWVNVLHTRRDQARAVNATSVYLGYRLALAMWSTVNDAPCDAYKQ